MSGLAAVAVAAVATAVATGAGGTPHGAPRGDRDLEPRAVVFPEAALRPAYLHLDRRPPAEWQLNDCDFTGPARGVHSHGILTIDAPGQNCWEYYLRYPDGVWHRWASNARGWIVEASIRVDPLSNATCSAEGSSDAARMFIHDDVNVVIVGVSLRQVCLFLPAVGVVTRPATGGFHTYRVEARGRIVRVFVDGRLTLSHTYARPAIGSRVLAFGDGTAGAEPGTSGSSRTQWDYVSYDTTPDFVAADWQGSAWPTT